MNAPSFTERVFLAGIIDGEGTIQMGKGVYPRIAVKMTDLDIIERLKAAYGGNISFVVSRASSLGKKPLFCWQLTESRQAAGVLMMIFPLVSARRQARITEVLTIWRDWSPPLRGAYRRQTRMAA